MSEDVRLVERCARGDDQALGALYDRHGADVYRLVRRLGLDGPAAEDVVQDAFLRVWRGAGSFRRGSPRGWIVRIALNRARDVLRREVRERAKLTRAPALSPSAGASRDLPEALDAIPAAVRTVVVMKYYESHTFDEIAAVLGVSVRTAKSRAALGLERLREILGHD